MALRTALSKVELGEADFLAVRIPDEEHPVWVALTGDRRGERGFIALRGPNALKNMMTLVAGDHSEGDVQILHLSFDRLDSLPESARHLLRSARFKPGPDELAPVLLVKEPNGARRRPTQRELMILCMVTGGLLLATEQGLLTPDSVSGERGPLTLVVSGDFQDPQLAVARGSGVGMEVSEPKPPATLAIDRNSLKGMDKLPRLKRGWFIGCPAAPLMLEGGSDSASRLLLIVERQTGRLVDGGAVGGHRWDFAATLRVIDIIQASGLPRQVLCMDRRLTELLCPELRALGIECRHEPAAWSAIEPAFDALVAELLEVED